MTDLSLPLTLDRGIAKFSYLPAAARSRDRARTWYEYKRGGRPAAGARTPRRPVREKQPAAMVLIPSQMTGGGGGGGGGSRPKTGFKEARVTGG
eukprot:COSAG03_NODE_5596_length_1213_cov_287.326750_2_plen_93_part_01